MIIRKNKAEIKKMRCAGQIVAATLQKVSAAVYPGVMTVELDTLAEISLREAGAIPAFKGYRGYPATLCTSVNDEVVHGIPGERVLCEGDIISLDLGANFDGFYADATVTCPVGAISVEAERLIRVTREAFYKGIEKATPGRRLGDVGAAIQQYAEMNGYSVVRDLVGHGIGRSLHEDPQVPNYGRPGHGTLLKEGMTLAIEPMINAGGYGIRQLADGWTIITADQSLSAHYEHTVALVSDGATILTEL
jgi:methionyl aminopeptidase